MPELAQGPIENIVRENPINVPPEIEANNNAQAVALVRLQGNEEDVRQIIHNNEDDNDFFDVEEAMDREEQQRQMEADARNQPEAVPRVFNRIFMEENPFDENPIRVRRGRRVIADGPHHLPDNLNPPQAKKPMPQAKFQAPVYKRVTKMIYVPGGVEYKGYRFSRVLTLVEKEMLKLMGYNDLLRKVPDLVYVEKEMPIDENEECVILLSELADHFAVQSCKVHIPDFSVETHTKEYQVVYKRYLKEIASFKRKTNG